MKKEQSHFQIKMMAEILGVSRSGFYAWIKRPLCKRKIYDEQIKPFIRAAHENSRKTYGSVRVKVELAENGITIGRDHITRLRKEMQFKCIQHKKFIATTNSNHDLPVSQNLLNQNFKITEPGTVYGTDITYIPTGEGWLYLAGVKDFGSREIIGYAMSERMTKELVQEALKKAMKYRKPQKGCIHHSDRGSQYCALSYQKYVRDSGLVSSMSRRGNCFDNAPTESFWSSLKLELIYQRKFNTRAEAKAAIQEYIEIFYNRIRRHSAVGNISPAKYADVWYSNKRKTA